MSAGKGFSGWGRTSNKKKFDEGYDGITWPSSSKPKGCDHVINPAMGMGWQTSTSSGHGHYCQKCGEWIGTPQPQIMKP